MMLLKLHDGKVVDVPIYSNISGLRIKEVTFDKKDFDLISETDEAIFPLVFSNIYVRMVK